MELIKTSLMKKPWLIRIKMQQIPKTDFVHHKGTLFLPFSHGFQHGFDHENHWVWRVWIFGNIIMNLMMKNLKNKNLTKIYMLSIKKRIIIFLLFGGLFVSITFIHPLNLYIYIYMLSINFKHLLLQVT